MSYQIFEICAAFKQWPPHETCFEALLANFDLEV